MSTSKMPVLFVGHGNPMNAIENNAFSRAWEEIGRVLPRPEAVLCISAHWETNGTFVTAMETPKTIHDFYGFPHALFEMTYPAPGSPDLARSIQSLVQTTPVKLDLDWGLDHGAWSVLCRMFPDAGIPVVQLSLDRTKEPAFHYALAKELAPLRERGVLIVGSGNMVHNLGTVVFHDEAFDWAIAFDETLKRLILAGDHEAVIHYEKLAGTRMAIPTNEHYLPLLYALALQTSEDALQFFAEKVTLGSISMRSFRLG